MDARMRMRCRVSSDKMQRLSVGDKTKDGAYGACEVTY